MPGSWNEAVEGASTFVEILSRRAAAHGDRVAYTFLAEDRGSAEEVTFAALETRARAIASRIRRLTPEGEPPRALMLYPSGLEFVTAFLGCLYARVTAVPAYPPTSPRHLPRVRAIARDARPMLVLADSPALARLEATAAALPELEGVARLATDTVAARLPHDEELTLPEPEDLAFLQYTSGSTAAPKGVMVSHGNLVHNAMVIKRQTGHSEATVFAGWLPLYHDMGLIGNVLQPLYLGIRCVLMSPVSFLRQPIRWLEAISHYRATTSGGPNFAYELCLRRISAEQKANLDLSSWNLAFSGAEPVRAETLERFAEGFADCGFRWEAFYPCYGMAETTLMISGGRGQRRPVIAEVDAAGLEQDRAEPARGGDVRRLVGSGRAGTDFEVAVADPTTRRRLGDGRVGEIWVASPSVARGYWNLPEVSEATFRARLEDEPHRGPFLRTGDLGFLRGGEVFVTGRLKDLIILRGRNHYPQDVEQTVERSHPALRPGCGVAVSADVDGEERLVVIQEVSRHLDDDPETVAEAVRRAVAEVHQVQVHDVVLIRTSTLPKTSSGKLQRRAALSEYRAGTLRVIRRSTLSAAAGEEVLGAELELDCEALLARRRRRPLLEDFLRDRVARLTRSAAAYVDPERPLTGQGLDSLVAVELKNAVESRLGVDVPLTRLIDGQTIAELAAAVLEQLEGHGDGNGSAAIATGEASQQREHPLSYGQEALWYLHRLDPGNAAYNVRGAGRIEGDLDDEALRRAAEALVLRHPALRTRFVQEEGKEPHALVDAEPSFAFEVHDAAGLGRDDLAARLADEINRPFDLERGPVLRLSVFVLAPREHLLLLVVHHLVADFWSLGLMFRELGVLYGELAGGGAATDGAATLDPLAVTYGDFARWQRARITGSEGERLWSYWREQLAGELPLLDLPTDRPRPAVQTFSGGEHSARFRGELSTRLKRLSAERGSTLFATLMAAFQVVLHRWSAQQDLLVGTPVTLRTTHELAPLVGYFVNPVVIRGDLARARQQPFTDFLDQVRRAALSAFAHQEYPLPLLAERLELAHDASRSPLFQVMFVWQQDRLPEQAGLAAFALGEESVRADLGPLTVRPVKLPETSAQFDLSLHMAEVEGRLSATLNYNTDLFDGSTARRLLGHVGTVLGAVAAAPRTCLAWLPLLTGAERRQLAEPWSAAPAGDAAPCLYELFAAQASRTPAAEAVAGGGQRRSYHELVRAANRLGRRLREVGVGPEVRVGVCMERCPEMIVAMLGVLAAGGTYVPLDPAYPRRRLAFLLEDSRVPVLLIHRAAPANLPGSASTAIDLARLGLWDDGVSAPPQNDVRPRNLAYLIYTSGSTGRPKGVAIPHASASAMVRWAGEVFRAEDLAGVLASTSICFDLSVFEIFVPLCHGGRVIVADNALELREQPEGEVTLVNTVPSAMRELVTGRQGLPASVRVVNLAGESLGRDLVRKVWERGSVERLFNLYGPSEDTTYSTFARLEQDDARAPSIGRPVSGSQVYLADGFLRLVPRGVAGELLLGGAGLARGYLGRGALTAEHFVPDPLSEYGGRRLYRTGDLARYRSDGDLEFLGRSDHQVKVRGFRIELGEIESALVRPGAVREAAVLAREDEGGDQQIVAFVVTGSQEPDLPELRRSITESLPAFMVPQAVVVLDSLPLTPNGKVDRAALSRKALPPPDKLPRGREYGFVAPETEVEEILAEMWREVLGIEEIGIHDDFFHLGGHSLKATRVLSHVRDTFEVDLPVRSLLEAPTIAGLEMAIARVLMEEADEETVAAALAEVE